MALRGIVFDLDDTLYPELDYVHSGFTAASVAIAQRFDRPAGEVQAQMECILAEELAEYGRARSVFDRTLEVFALPTDAETISWLVEVYRSHAPMLVAYDDVVPTLDDLAKRGVAIGLLSDGYATVQRAKFDALDLGDRFSAIVFTDELGADAWKPSTMGFESIEVQLGLTGDELAYVGDNPAKDFQGARALGWTTFRIRRPGGLHLSREASSAEGAPDHEITTLDELEAYLDA